MRTPETHISISEPTVPPPTELEKKQKAAADRRDFVSGMQKDAAAHNTPVLWSSRGELDTVLVIQDQAYADAGTVKRTMRTIQIKLLSDFCREGFTDVELAVPGMSTPVTRIPLECWQADLSEPTRKVIQENK
jgi:hypothetical protein